LSAKEDLILVVDDEEPVRDVVSKLVKHIGYPVLMAANGKHALDLMRKEPVTILITDIKMPEMDGFELMKAALAEFPDLHIICMTAHGGAYSYTDVVSFGAADYITKPFTIDEMSAKLSRVIREMRLIEDLREKKIGLEQANEELKRADTLKSTFISSVSHELRTPLTVIKEFISLMLEGHGGAVTEDQREYLTIANKNILRLTNLIETLLDFSRIESGKGLKLKFEPIRLNGVIEDAIMTLSQRLEEKGITFENRLDPDIPMILGDHHRLVEVFINLFGNGIKFTPPGGKITVDSRGLTERRDFLKVVVADTGVGISQEDLPKVFDRFYQGHRTQEGMISGTGLGLAITKEIIEGHRGTIAAESKSGGGAVFVFTLPLFGVDAIFSLILNAMLEEGEKDKLPLSLVEVNFWDPRKKLEASLTPQAWEGVMYALQKMIRAVDSIVPFQNNNKIYIFSFNDKKLAKEIGERIQIKLIQGGYVSKGTDVQIRTYTYPKEARSKEEFMRGCRQFIKEE
jgi:signal transduction histidine kinase